ncbi:MAG: hypothetical protein WCY19_05740 [Candidatus Gastranaerophilaceae bacterium]
MILPVSYSQHQTKPYKQNFCANVFKPVGSKVLDSENVSQAIGMFQTLVKDLYYGENFVMTEFGISSEKFLEGTPFNFFNYTFRPKQSSVKTLKEMVNVIAEKFPDVAAKLR